MVVLSFSFFADDTIDKVAAYFSNFETIMEWDPNVKKSKLIKETNNKVGSEYALVTIWGDKQNDIVYTVLEYKHNKYIKLKGENNLVEAIDEIFFEPGDKPNKTKVSYKADISLKGVGWLITPFIVKDLEKIAVDCEAGMIKRANIKFGRRPSKELDIDRIVRN